MYNMLSGLAACGHVGVATRAGGVLFVTPAAHVARWRDVSRLESVDCQ